MASWLVTWEATSESKLPAKRIALVMDGRIGAEKVREAMEVLYASYRYTEAELVTYRTKGKNPYRAEFGEYHGSRFQGRITCGHNPHLYARLVDELEPDASGHVTWQEPPPPFYPRPVR